jgi:hypothetical protein
LLDRWRRLGFFTLKETKHGCVEAGTAGQRPVDSGSDNVFGRAYFTRAGLPFLAEVLTNRQFFHLHGRTNSPKARMSNGANAQQLPLVFL